MSPESFFLIQPASHIKKSAHACQQLRSVWKCDTWVVKYWICGELWRIWGVGEMVEVFIMEVVCLSVTLSLGVMVQGA